MEIANNLSKFIIQENSNSFDLYTEDKIAFEFIKTFLKSNRYSFQILDKTIFINKLTYNFLIKSAKNQK